ncbi:MAG: type IV toxin-antitoxin system AbiEi family antitoxin domain-containing protein [Candidatus Obscuribacterales bacterium]|nr:type IV toxin-antitoxin system AbiEi family antitoxin domain-containing protein [Candidatus Obscuribacterales bacterium]
MSFAHDDTTDDKWKAPILDVSSSLRRYINMAPEGTMFTTAELRTLGKRKAIDKFMSRAAAAGLLFRLARGVYLKPRSDVPAWRPPIEDIVMAKVRAFQRDVVPSPSNESLLQKGSQPDQTDNSIPSAEDEIHLDTNGNTSSFRLYNGLVVKLKHIAMRKFDLAQSAVGRKLRDLWASVEALNPSHLMQFSQSLGREERRDVKVLLPLLPHWLSDVLGSSWIHKWEVHRFSRRESSGTPSAWFSSLAISRSRAHRSSSRPAPVNWSGT